MGPKCDGKAHAYKFYVPANADNSAWEEAIKILVSKQNSMWLQNVFL